MGYGLPFQFEVPVSFFEKADAPEGKRRRIGGIISTENPDRQGETVLQDGLDFSDFKKNGWFNDNHSKDTDGVVGYPEKVEKFKKGDELPTGEKAKTSGHWAEGYMLGTERANKIWELGKALQGTGRKLGFSVEGKILHRDGPKTIARKSDDGKVEWTGSRIAKALVRNVAVTNCPVNVDTGLEVLARSISAVEASDPDSFEARLEIIEKALAMGPATPGVAIATQGPQEGVGAGKVLAPKSLESKQNPPKPIGKGGAKKKKKKLSKSLSDAEAVLVVQWALPNTDAATAGRIVELSKELKRNGKL